MDNKVHVDRKKIFQSNWKVKPAIALFFFSFVGLKVSAVVLPQDARIDNRRNGDLVQLLVCQSDECRRVGPRSGLTLSEWNNVRNHCEKLGTYFAPLDDVFRGLMIAGGVWIGGGLGFSTIALASFLPASSNFESIYLASTVFPGLLSPNQFRFPVGQYDQIAQGLQQCYRHYEITTRIYRKYYERCRFGCG